MRLIYLIKKEWIEILRQKEMLFLIFIAPIFQIIILGYVVTTDIKNISVEIINLSHLKSTGQIINRINAQPLFRVAKISTLHEDYPELLKKGRVKAVIIFRDPEKAGPYPLKYPEIQVLLDGVDPNASLLAAGYFNGILKNYILSDIGRRGIPIPIENKTLIRFNPELKAINYMGPAIVALLLTVMTMFSTSNSLVREREQQTMDTLLISRLTPLEIYMGKALPAALIGLINMFIGILAIVFWFNIPIRGSLFLLFAASVIYLMAIISYALFLSTLFSTQQQVMYFTWVSMVLFILLSGFLTPLENIPSRVIIPQMIAAVNPFRYLIQIIRAIFLKGTGISSILGDLSLLLLISLGFLSLSLLNFRRMVSR